MKNMILCYTYLPFLFNSEQIIKTFFTLSHFIVFHLKGLFMFIIRQFLSDDGLVFHPTALAKSSFKTEQSGHIQFPLPLGCCVRGKRKCLIVNV